MENVTNFLMAMAVLVWILSPMVSMTGHAWFLSPAFCYSEAGWAGQ